MSEQIKYAPSLAAALAILGEGVGNIRQSEQSEGVGTGILAEVDDLAREIVGVMRNESPSDSSDRQAVLTKARSLIERLSAAGWVESLGPGPNGNPGAHSEHP